MPKRECGECSECCSILPIIELNKPRRMPCKHLCAKGCGIYKDPKKPRVCNVFRCEWLRGNLAEWDRPDKLGVMFWFSAVLKEKSHLRVSELRAGVFEKKMATVKQRVQRIIQRHHKKTGNRLEVMYVPYDLPGKGLPGDGYEDHISEKAGDKWLDYKPVSELALAT